MLNYGVDASTGLHVVSQSSTCEEVVVFGSVNDGRRIHESRRDNKSFGAVSVRGDRDAVVALLLSCTVLQNLLGLVQVQQSNSSSSVCWYRVPCNGCR